MKKSTAIGGGHIKLEKGLNGHGDNVTLAFNPNDGTGWAVWQKRLKDGILHIQGSRFVPETGWEEPIVIDKLGIGQATDPLITFNSETNMFVLIWLENEFFQPFHIRISQNRNNEGWFYPAFVEKNFQGPPAEHRIVLDNQGVATVIWEQSSQGVTSIWANRISLPE